MELVILGSKHNPMIGFVGVEFHHPRECFGYLSANRIPTERLVQHST
jgi:hypothetical protein